jgi:hypothetical protein
MMSFVILDSSVIIIIMLTQIIAIGCLVYGVVLVICSMAEDLTEGDAYHYLDLLGIDKNFSSVDIRTLMVVSGILLMIAASIQVFVSVLLIIGAKRVEFHKLKL